MQGVEKNRRAAWPSGCTVQDSRRGDGGNRIGIGPLMSFLGLAINYGFRPDFLSRWLFAFVTGYVILVPVLLFILPIVQRVVVRYFAPFQQ